MRLTRIELVRSAARDFKSLVSTYFTTVAIGRRYRIRTCDPLLPKQMRYQTALISVKLIARYRESTSNILLLSFLSPIKQKTLGDFSARV